MRLSIGIGAKNPLPEAERVFMCLIFFAYGKFGSAMTDLQYIGFREITTRCIGSFLYFLSKLGYTVYRRDHIGQKGWSEKDSN